MSNTRFEQFKSNMESVGLEIDPRVDQQDVDGLLGMYATETIPAGTTLAKFPLNSRIPAVDGFDFSGFPDSSRMSQLHGIAKAISTKNPSFSNYFEYCGTLSELKENRVYFFDEADFQSIHEMNVLLAKQAFYAKAEFLANVQNIKSIDPDIADSDIEYAAAIWRERCWGSLGFMPGMDLFNHNTRSLLSPREVELDGEKYAVIESVQEIAAGEQIYVSYGKKDAFQFLTYYNFYDESDLHLITYSARVEQEVKDDFVGQIVNLLKATYDVVEFEKNGKPFFRVNEPNALFLEHGPNGKMVELASKLSVNSEEQILMGQSDAHTTASYLLHILLSFKKANRVSEVSIDDLSEKLHPYHRMLSREMVVLDQNIEAVKARLLVH